MSTSRFIIAYIISVSLLPFSVFGIFHNNFITLNDENLVFYVRSSSVFCAVVLMFLAWYYSNIIIKGRTLAILNEFGLQATNLNVSKVTTEDAMRLTNDVVSRLKVREINKFALFGFAVPFFFMSLTTAVMILNISSSAFYSLPITIILYTGMTFVASEIVERCDIRLYKNTFCKFVENVVEASKGIQFYGAQEFVANKLVEAEKEVFNKMRGDVSKFVWKAFFYICFLFLTACIAYIAKIEFVKLHLFSATGYESLFLSFSFFYIVSCGAFFKFLKINDAITAESTIITHNALSHKPDGTKKLQENRIFIAFHGIYFQDSTKISDTPILSNVSFSALPGEQISITGENFFKGRYIFELILKYYSAQSGKIYISGIPIDNIQMHSLRASIGIFKQNFGIVRGTVYDNLAMLAIDESQILTISERVGLQDNLNNEVYDDYDADVSQEILFKIQIARIVVQKPKVILVETPQYFASGYVEEIFYAFVEHIAKKCTVFIMTNNPNVIIYSDKILYFGIGESLFGTHAELSKNKYYQDYVRSLNI